MDQQLFYFINNFAGRWHILDVIAVFLADQFVYVFGLIILALWFNKSLRRHVYLAIASALVSRIIIVEILKRLLDHPRPYEILSNIQQLLVDNEHGKSFPSGHAAIFFSFAFAFYGTKYFWPFFILACIGSFARVIAGLHYPSDIIAGALIGALLTLAYRRLFKKQILG